MAYTDEVLKDLTLAPSHNPVRLSDLKPSQNIEPLKPQEKNNLRTITQGIPGQDGYGKITITPGSSSVSEVSRQQKLNQLNQLGNDRVIANQGELEFQGTGADAAKFFESPNYSITPKRNNQVTFQPQATKRTLANLTAPPVYGSHGGGWKSRLALYKADLDAYNQATGQNLQADIAQMQERGAGLRSLAQAKHWENQDALLSQQATEESALNRLKLSQGQREDTYQAKVEAARTAYMENPSEENKVRLSNLLYDPNKAKQPDVRVVDKFDPLTGQKMGQSILRDSGAGNYVDVTPKETEHPAIRFLRSNNTPQNRALFKRKYGQLPEGFEE